MSFNKEEELKIQTIKDWILTQEHLPQELDNILICRYISSCKGDIEETKKLIEFSYTLRNKYPNIFIKRNPTEPQLKNALTVADIIPLPNPSAQNYNLYLMKLGDLDADKFDFTEAVKAFFVIEDTRCVTQYSTENGIGDGEIPIFDMKGFTLKHLTKVTILTLKVYFKYLQEGSCIRLKHIHVMNCSSVIEKIMFLVKPFLKTEVYEMLHFHYPNTDTLDKFVAKELLPAEYGGKAGTIEEIKSYWLKKVEEKRDYLMDEKHWKINDAKRKNKAAVVFEDSFKSIAFD